MKRRIGILTSGGDCPGLNAAIRGVAKAAYNLFDAEIIGIENGYQGLIYGHAQTMEPEDFSGYLLFHKHGAPPHGGLGIGLERLTMQLCGLDNIRRASLFPRDRTRLEP